MLTNLSEVGHRQYLAHCLIPADDFSPPKSPKPETVPKVTLG